MIEVTDKERKLVEDLMNYAADIKKFAEDVMLGMQYVTKKLEDYDDEEAYKPIKEVYKTLKNLTDIYFGIGIEFNHLWVNYGFHANYEKDLNDKMLINLLRIYERDLYVCFTTIMTLNGCYDIRAFDLEGRITAIIGEYLNQ